MAQSVAAARHRKEGGGDAGEGGIESEGARPTVTRLEVQTRSHKDKLEGGGKTWA